MNFFYQVRESVIDFKFYKLIKDNRFAKSFLYLLLLLLIVYSMLTVRNYLLVKNILEQASFELSESMPDFQLKDGKFSFEGEMPFYISSSTNEVFIIDTTGTVDKKALQNAMTGILITENNIYIKNNAQQQELSFSEMKDTEFNKASLIERLPSLSWMVLIIMLLWFVFALGGHLLYVLILALVGLAISASLNADLKYKQVLNFSIYALTLPMLIDLAFDIATLPMLIGFGGSVAAALMRQLLYFTLYTGIAIVYLYLAIKTNIENKVQLEQPKENDSL
ncbi:MAG: hypothetical protein A2Y23_14985 [Clostridiales bacterium GWB2_37_7]|nr:MAG: hypothetical protein A2Y23_14985 [Clostridiales bacterium GWB2_37_7]